MRNLEKSLRFTLRVEGPKCFFLDRLRRCYFGVVLRVSLSTQKVSVRTRGSRSWFQPKGLLFRLALALVLEINLFGLVVSFCVVLLALDWEREGDAWLMFLTVES